VVGTGINLNVEPSSLPKSATSTFKATGRILGRDIMLEALLEELQSSYDDLNDKEKIFREWWEHCVHRSKPVAVIRPEGAISGISTGIGPDGQLLVKTSSRDVLEIPEGTILPT
jgi:biotin-(acetyl-CoA carboxylase) ligase